MPKFLLPEHLARTNGAGSPLTLGPDRGKLLVLTLGIDRVLEQGELHVSVWGSANGTEWGSRPLIAFPPKCYCGLYSQLLNLAKHPDIRSLRMEWKMTRWAKGNSDPLFGFYLSAEESGARLGVNPGDAEMALSVA